MVAHNVSEEDVVADTITDGDGLVTMGEVNGVHFDLNGLQGSEDFDVLGEDPVTALRCRTWDVDVAVVEDLDPDTLLGRGGGFEVRCYGMLAEMPARSVSKALGGMIAGFEPSSVRDDLFGIDEERAEGSILTELKELVSDEWFVCGGWLIRIRFHFSRCDSSWFDARGARYGGWASIPHGCCGGCCGGCCCGYIPKTPMMESNREMALSWRSIPALSSRRSALAEAICSGVVAHCSAVATVAECQLRIPPATPWTSDLMAEAWSGVSANVGVGFVVVVGSSGCEALYE